MARKFSMCPFYPFSCCSHLFGVFIDTDVLYLRLLATDVVVLNTSEVISDLCEKRSNIYCDRVSFRAKPMTVLTLGL